MYRNASALIVSGTRNGSRLAPVLFPRVGEDELIKALMAGR
jgi:hypothetical protein